MIRLRLPGVIVLLGLLAPQPWRASYLTDFVAIAVSFLALLPLTLLNGLLIAFFDHRRYYRSQTFSLGHAAVALMPLLGFLVVIVAWDVPWTLFALSGNFVLVSLLPLLLHHRERRSALPHTGEGRPGGIASVEEAPFEGPPRWPIVLCLVWFGTTLTLPNTPSSAAAVVTLLSLLILVAQLLRPTLSGWWIAFFGIGFRLLLEQLAFASGELDDRTTLFGLARATLPGICAWASLWLSKPSSGLGRTEG